MINMFEVSETNNMITQEKLDVRTITMGISLLDCIDSSVEKVCENVYNKITTLAKNLVSTGKDIEKEYGIPIVNKRISVTPIALVGSAACKTTDDFVEIAKSLDRAGCHPAAGCIQARQSFAWRSAAPAGQCAPGCRLDRKSTRLNSSHPSRSRMPSSA